MTKTQDQRAFRIGGDAEAENHGQGQSQNSKFTHATPHMCLWGHKTDVLCIISQMRECFFTSESKRAKFFFQQAPVFLGVYGDVMITVITFLMQKCIIWGGGKFGRKFFLIYLAIKTSQPEYRI